MKEKAVLFIDDEENILKAITRQLALSDYKVYTAKNYEEAYQILKAESIPVVVSDQRMPEMSGSELLALIKKEFPKTVRMIISGYTDFDALQEAINQGQIFKFIPKPWEESYLIDSLERAFQQYSDAENKDKKNRVLDNALEGVIITNVDDKIESANLSFQLLTGYSNNEMTGKNIWDFFNSFDHEESRNVLEEVHLQKVWQGETSLKIKTGSKIPGILSISEVTDKERGSIYHSFSFLHIPELKQRDIELNNIKSKDPETNFLNRLGFEQEISNWVFSKDNEQLYVVVFYFPKLNQVTNAFGKTFTNHALTKISGILKEHLKMSDLCGRISFTAFGILMNKKAKEDVLAAIRDLKIDFGSPLHIDEQSLHLKPAIGICKIPSAPIDSSTLVDQALLAAEYALQYNCEEAFYSSSIDHQIKMNFQPSSTSTSASASSLKSSDNQARGK